MTKIQQISFQEDIQAKQLSLNRWKESPHWLMDSAEYKNAINSSSERCNEEVVKKEKLNQSVYSQIWKLILTLFGITVLFQAIKKIVHYIVWISRFIHYCSIPSEKSQDEFHSGLNTVFLIKKKCIF